MAFFVTDTSEQATMESTGGNFINASGIYDVTLKIVSVETNDKGARSLNFNIDHKGQDQVLWGLKLDNNDGSENHERKIFNRLAIIAGLDRVEKPTLEEHKIGKDQTPTDLQVLTEFTDMDVKVRVQLEYSQYQGKIYERKVIKSFYRASDGASAQEIVAGEGFGTQLEKDQAYADNVTYKDNLTKEVVDAWIKAGRGKGKDKGKAATTATNDFAQNPTTPSAAFPG